MAAVETVTALGTAPRLIVWLVRSRLYLSKLRVLRSDADAAATATCVRAHDDLAGWLQTLAEKKPKLQTIVLLKDEPSQAIRFISNAADLGFE